MSPKSTVLLPCQLFLGTPGICFVKRTIYNEKETIFSQVMLPLKHIFKKADFFKTWRNVRQVLKNWCVLPKAGHLVNLSMAKWTYCLFYHFFVVHKLHLFFSVKSLNWRKVTNLTKLWDFVKFYIRVRVCSNLVTAPTSTYIQLHQDHHCSERYKTTFLQDLQNTLICANLSNASSSLSARLFNFQMPHNAYINLLR